MTHARPTSAASRALRAVSKRPAATWQIRQEWLDGNVAELAGNQTWQIRQEWLDGNFAELAGKPDRNDAESAGMAHKSGMDARGRPVLPDKI